MAEWTDDEKKALGIALRQLREVKAGIKTIRGKVIVGNDENKPVSGVLVSYQASDLAGRCDTDDVKTDENGNFEIKALKAPVYIEAVTPDGKFGKVVVIQPPESGFTVSLEPTASIRGQLVDCRSDKPLVGQSVQYSIRIPVSTRNTQSIPSFLRKVVTNENGEYEFRNLPTGHACHVVLKTHHYGETKLDGGTFIENYLQLESGKESNRGIVPFDARPLDEYIYQTHNVYIGNYPEDEENRLEQRFDVLLERAKRDGKGVFAILVRDEPERDYRTNDFEAIPDIYDMLFEKDDVFAHTERFYMMCVFMQPEADSPTTTTMAREFVVSHKIAEPLPSLFSFAFFSELGTLRGVESFDHTATPEERKRQLIEMMKKY
jgi:hypothetical protein